jgi:hypothetical protein
MKRMSFKKINLCNSIKNLSKIGKSTPISPKPLTSTATNVCQFVHHMHPRLPAKFESTSPINDEVIQGGVKISRKK